MGQKTHPRGFRLGITKGWDANWYAGRHMAPLVILDQQIREYVEKNYRRAYISRIYIARTMQRTKIRIFVSRPGILIGRGGEAIEALTLNLKKLIRQFNRTHDYLLKQPLSEDIDILVHEVENPDTDAQIIALNIAEQLESRVSHRRAMKMAIMYAMRGGTIEGIKIRCNGRLGGSDMARSEEYKEGRISLQTLRADVDVGVATAYTIYGTIGVRVLISRGEVYGKVDLFPTWEERSRRGPREKGKKR